MMGVGLLISQGALKRGVAGGGFSDTFTRADSAVSLGTSTSGTAWTQVAGTMGISSNKGYSVTPASPSIAVVDTLLSSFTATCLFTGNNSTSDFAAFVFRYVDSVNYWAIESEGGLGRIKLYKVVAGTTTVVGGQTNNFANDSTSIDVRVVASGSSITVTTDSGATAVTSTTDSFNATATKCGWLTYGTNQKIDNVSVA